MQSRGVVGTVDLDYTFFTSKNTLCYASKFTIWSEITAININGSPGILCKRAVFSLIKDLIVSMTVAITWTIKNASKNVIFG